MGAEVQALLEGKDTMNAYRKKNYNLFEFCFSTLRNGTCFTSSECANRGGAASGNCAAGFGYKNYFNALPVIFVTSCKCFRFGVCCIFLISASGGTVDQNCSYIQNCVLAQAHSYKHD